jgi:hypothetical protein
MFKLCDQGFDVEFENGLVACVRWRGYPDGVTAVDCYVWSRASGCLVGKAEKLSSSEVIRFLNETVSLEHDNDIVLKLRAERCSKLDMAKAADEVIILRAMQSAYIETINKLKGCDRFKNDVVDANANNQDFRTTDMG